MSSSSHIYQYISIFHVPQNVRKTTLSPKKCHVHTVLYLEDLGTTEIYTNPDDLQKITVALVDAAPERQCSCYLFLAGTSCGVTRNKFVSLCIIFTWDFFTGWHWQEIWFQHVVRLNAHLITSHNKTCRGPLQNCNSQNRFLETVLAACSDVLVLV